MKDGASAVIVSGNKILLFHRDNNSKITFPDCWQLPGGGIEEGETPVQAVRRELEEEVSYVPRKLVPVGYYDNLLGKNYIFIAFVTKEEEAKFKHNPGEGQEIGFFTLDEALNLKLTLGLRWVAENKVEFLKEIIEKKKVPSASELGALEF